MSDSSGSAPDFQAILDESGSATQNAIRLLWNIVVQTSQRLGAFIAGLGMWKDVPYASGNFTASGSMTWTVDSGDQTNFEYVLIGKTMTVNFRLDATTLGGTASTTLKIKIPAGYKSANRQFDSVGFAKNNGATFYTPQIIVEKNDTVISIWKPDETNWALGTNNNDFRGQITFEVQ